MAKVIFELVVEDAGLSAQIERTRATIRDLNKEIRQNPGPERFNQLAGELQKNRRQLQELTKEQRALNKQFEALKVPKNSLAGLRLEYGRLSQAIANLTAEERRSQFGQNLIKNARNTKKEIDSIEQSIGRFTGNVGNYQSALSGLGRAFAALGIGVTVNEIIAANTRIADSIADVAKTAGITTQEAQRLADALELRDTRTSLADQLQIAQIGGQLGIAADQLEGFTASVDVLNVSLGDQFGNVEEITRVIAGLRNVLTDFRTDDTSGDILRLGNALNFLEAQGNATAPTIAEFVNRISGSAIPLGVTTDEIFGLSTALAELSITPERGATAVNILLTEIAKAPDVFANALSIPAQEFDRLVREDLIGALALISEKVTQGAVDNVEFAQTLDELGIGRQGAIEVFGKLGGNIDLLTKRVEESRGALQATDSVYAEFDKKNNNAAAAVEKLQNAVINLIASEGAQDAIEAVAAAVTNLIEVLGESIELVSENKEVFGALAAVLLSATGPGAKLNAVLLSLLQSTRAAAIGMTEMTAATAANTVSTNVNAAATRVLAAVQAALPLLALAAGIYLVVKAFDTYNAGLSTAEKASRAVADAQEEIAQSSAKEVAALNASIGVLQDSAASQEARARAIKQLTDAYPEYLKGVDLELQSTAQLTVIQRELTAEIVRGAAARAKANAQENVASEIIKTQLELQEVREGRGGTRFVSRGGGRSFGVATQEESIKALESELDKLNAQLEETGKQFDKAFKLDQPVQSSVIDIVDPRSLKKDAEQLKEGINGLSKEEKKAAEKSAKEREKRAEDERRDVEAQEKRTLEIRKSLRDLSIDDEEGFNAQLADLENKRVDALEKNAERLDALRASIRERTGREVTGTTGAELISQVPNARPADITEADLIDQETAALNASFDRQRDELTAQREETARQQQAQLQSLLLEVNQIAAENEVAVAEGVQQSIELGFADQREALQREFDQRNRLLAEGLTAGTIKQKEFDEAQLANQIEFNNRSFALEQEYATRISEVASQVRDVKIAAAKSALDAQLDAIEQQRRADIADIAREGGTDTVARVSLINEKAAQEAEAAQIKFAEAVKNTTRGAEQTQLSAVDSVSAAQEAAHQAELQRIQAEADARRRVVDAAIDTAAQIGGSLLQIQQNRLQQETDAELTALDEEYAKRIELAQGNTQLEAKLEKELQDKKEKVQKEAAEKQKRFSITEALINTAVAVTKALTGAIPPFNFILAGLAAAAGAFQVAAIRSAQFAEGGFGGKRKRKGEGVYPVHLWEALPSFDSGGHTGGGLPYRDSTGHRVAGKLPGGGVVHAGEYINPAWHVEEDPEIFNAMEAARRLGRPVSDYIQVRQFAAGGPNTLSLPAWVRAPSFQAGGFSDPIIGLPSSAQLQQQMIVVQSNATFTEAQVEQIGRIIAAENAKATRTALGEGIGDANRRLEREQSLEKQRSI